MRNWQHHRKTDIALRLCGAILCGLSYLAITALVAMRLADGQLPDGALPLLLAGAVFLCASAGSALLVLGHHIFDEIEISQHWQTLPPPDDSPAIADAFVSLDDSGERQLLNPQLNSTDHVQSIFVAGRDGPASDLLVAKGAAGSFRSSGTSARAQTADYQGGFRLTPHA